MSTRPVSTSTVDPRPWSPVGFGAIRFRRIFRATGNGSLPEWEQNPRVVVFKLANGGVERQIVGSDPTTLTLRIELESGADAQALQALIATAATLTLPDEFGSIDSAYEWIVNARYRIFEDVTLGDVQIEERTINGFVRATVRFEVDA